MAIKALTSSIFRPCKTDSCPENDQSKLGDRTRLAIHACLRFASGPPSLS